MGSRDEIRWRQAPKLPETHYVDGRVYHDAGVFEDERRKLFGKIWAFVCHESELPAKHDFRTTELAGTPLVAQEEARLMVAVETAQASASSSTPSAVTRTWLRSR